MITMSDIRRLDKFSLVEVERIIEAYEDLRCEVSIDYNGFCNDNNLDPLDVNSCETFKKSFGKFIRDECKGKYFAVLDQMVSQKESRQ